MATCESSSGDFGQETADVVFDLIFCVILFIIIPSLPISIPYVYNLLIKYF